MKKNKPSSFGTLVDRVSRLTQRKANIWMTVLVILVVFTFLLFLLTLPGRGAGAIKSQAASRHWWEFWSLSTSTANPPGTPTIEFIPSYLGGVATPTAGPINAFRVTSEAGDNFIDHFIMDDGNGKTGNSSKCVSTDIPKQCQIIFTATYLDPGSYTIKATAVDDTGLKSAVGQTTVTLVAPVDQLSIWLQNHPNAPTITAGVATAGQQTTFNFHFTPVASDYTTSAKKNPVAQSTFCKLTQIYIHWGDSNSPPETVLAAENGCRYGQSGQALHTYAQGGKYMVRAWLIDPTNTALSVPEGQLQVMVKGSPQSPIVCADDMAMTAQADSANPDHGTAAYSDQAVNFGKFKYSSQKEGWLTQLFVTKQIQSNLGWDKDFRRITVVDASGFELGHASTGNDPRTDANPLSSADGSGIESDNNRGGTIDPHANNFIATVRFRVPITPIHFASGETKVFGLIGTMNSQAVNNNLLRLGLAGGQCYGGPNLLQGTPRYFIVGQVATEVLGPIMRVDSFFNPSSIQAPNNHPCQWGTPRNQCDQAVSATSGISTRSAPSRTISPPASQSTGDTRTGN